jgi:hypothetical protein
VFAAMPVLVFRAAASTGQIVLSIHTEDSQFLAGVGLGKQPGHETSVLPGSGLALRHDELFIAAAEASRLTAEALYCRSNQLPNLFLIVASAHCNAALLSPSLPLDLQAVHKRSGAYALA